MGDIPLIGGIIKHIGTTVAGAIPGIAEVVRVYADNPALALNALAKYIHRQGPIGVSNFQYILYSTFFLN